MLTKQGHLTARQFHIPLLDAVDELPPSGWDVDFYLPAENLLIEAKGEWIAEKHMAVDRELFLVKVRLARQKGYQVAVLGNSDFNVGKLKVHNYRNFQL